MKQSLRFLPWMALVVVAVISSPRPAGTQPLPTVAGTQAQATCGTYGQGKNAAITRAVASLEQARDYLSKAEKNDFCGHRNAALEEIDKTIQHLKGAAACSKDYTVLLNK